MGTVAIRILLCLALPAATGVVRAQEADCSRFATYGLVPGIGLKEARNVLESGGLRSEPSSRWSMQENVEVYVNPPVSILLEFDRPVTRKNHTYLMVIRTYGPVSDLDPEALRTSLLKRYGQPLAGLPNLEAGLDPGPAVWVDEACNAEVVVYREPAQWWEQRDASICVETRRMDDRVPFATPIR